MQVGASSDLPKIITTGFRAIQLIYFFTAGDDEVKCWQIRKGSKAPQVLLAVCFSLALGMLLPQWLRLSAYYELRFASAACLCSCSTSGGLLQAAGAIHSDFERGFICAETMTYEELHELETEAAAKAAGKYRQQGKNYVVQDGDIIFFKFNVTSTGKK